MSGIETTNTQKKNVACTRIEYEQVLRYASLLMKGPDEKMLAQAELSISHDCPAKIIFVLETVVRESCY